MIILLLIHFFVIINILLLPLNPLIIYFDSIIKYCTVLITVGLCLPLKDTIINCDYLSALYMFTALQTAEWYSNLEGSSKLMNFQNPVL